MKIPLTKDRKPTGDEIEFPNVDPATHPQRDIAVERYFEAKLKAQLKQWADSGMTLDEMQSMAHSFKLDLTRTRRTDPVAKQLEAMKKMTPEMLERHRAALDEELARRRSA